MLRFRETRPKSGTAWTDDGEAHDRRGLKAGTRQVFQFAFSPERRKGLRSALLLVTDPFDLVAALGFEPRKAEPADLQRAPPTPCDLRFPRQSTLPGGRLGESESVGRRSGRVDGLCGVPAAHDEVLVIAAVGGEPWVPCPRTTPP